MTALAQKSTRRSLFVIGRMVLGLGISAGLGWLVVRGLDWSLVGDAFRGLSLPTALLALLVFLASNFLRAYRWQLLFINDRISVPRLFVVENEGLGLNNLMPLRVAAEAIQWTVLTVRDRINGATALATLGMVRVLDVVASTLILGLAFVFMPEMSNFTFYVVGAIVFALVCIILIRFLSWGSHRLSIIQRLPPLAAFASAVATMEKSPRRLGASFFLSIIYWLMIGLTAWLIAESMDLSLSLPTATVVIMGTTFFATVMPAAPGAIGTFEAAVVYGLGFFGIERESAFGYAVIMHALLYLPPSIIALIFLPGEGVGAFRRLRNLTGQFQRLTNRARS